jgi:4-amino-4-deoxy-L-arabinose transferase-like glycosyltransferase
MARVKAGVKTHTWWTGLVLLLLLVFAMRAWDLMDVPPGLTHDEASNGHDSAAILAGVHRIYFPVGYGHEPLYNYSAALATLFLGQGIFTLRITTVFWGIAQCVLAVALARRWWGRRTALAVLAAYALSFWALMLARVGLRAPVLPALFAAAALAYDHAITAGRGRGWGGYLVAGICVGAGFYTYMASRGMPLVFPLFLLALSFTTRRSGNGAPQTENPARALWPGTLALLTLALAIGAPLFLHLRANPELEQRIGQLGHALTALRAGDWRPLWGNVRDSLPMLFWHGDPYWLYNVAGRPGLEPVLAVGFGAGLVRALSRLRDRRHLFLLIWLAGGLAPALIAPVAYNLLHAIAALPAALLLAGRGIDLLLSAAASTKIVRRSAVGRWAVAALAGSLLMATGWETAHAYFVTWANHRDVRVAYHHHLVALGRHIATQDNPGPVVITSLYPGEFHDPYTMEVTLGRKEPAIRWSDGGQALFVPVEGAWLSVNPHAPPAPGLWPFIDPDLELDADLTFRQDDLVSVIHTYRWDAPATWARIAAALTTPVGVEGGDPPPRTLLAVSTTSGVDRTGIKTAPVHFGDLIVLEGYVLNPEAPEQPQLAPGSTLTLMTAWQVTAPTDEAWTVFVHLLDPEGHLVTQDDRLGAPSWQWQPGDRFVQLHQLALPESPEPGPYALALGLYASSDLRRPQIDAGGDLPATRVLLPLGELRP